MPPAAVADFVKRWFDEPGPIIPNREPRLLAMRAAQYSQMCADWREMLQAHLPSALDQAHEALNSVLYQLNITLRVTNDTSPADN